MDIERKIRIAAGLAFEYHNQYLKVNHSKEQRKHLINTKPRNTLLLSYKPPILTCECYVCSICSYKEINTISSHSSLEDLAAKAVILSISKNKSLQNIEYYTHLITKLLKL
jgi:hypothetical protein